MKVMSPSSWVPSSFVEAMIGERRVESGQLTDLRGAQDDDDDDDDDICGAMGAGALGKKLPTRVEKGGLEGWDEVGSAC